MGLLGPGADFFVSYSHGDPHSQGDSRLESWTHALVDKLRSNLANLDPKLRNLWILIELNSHAHFRE